MNKRLFLINWLEKIWYGSRPFERTLLLPLSTLFCAGAKHRRKKMTEWQRDIAVPVIVVGNIAVGGTGKTPLTIRLAQLLREHGYYPGIVSRGYGAQTNKNLVKSVSYHHKPEDVGDEALLLAARTGLPVVVGIERMKAVSHLLDDHNVDVILSDDGLQHYALARDLEIMVIDGTRRFGNGHCLPAGPLREPQQRIEECDFIICNGQAHDNEFAMQLIGSWLVSIQDKRVSQPLSELRDKAVHVVTAIGNPQRFVSALEQAGLSCTTHFYPDHYLFQGDEFNFADNLPVLMTEKDAVKCQQFSNSQIKNCWHLPVNAQLDEAFEQAFLAKVKDLINNKLGKNESKKH